MRTPKKTQRKKQLGGPRHANTEVPLNKPKRKYKKRTPEEKKQRAEARKQRAGKHLPSEPATITKKRTQGVGISAKSVLSKQDLQQWVESLAAEATHTWPGFSVTYFLQVACLLQEQNKKWGIHQLIANVMSYYYLLCQWYAIFGTRNPLPSPSDFVRTRLEHWLQLLNEQPRLPTTPASLPPLGERIKERSKAGTNAFDELARLPKTEEILKVEKTGRLLVCGRCNSTKDPVKWETKQARRADEPDTIFAECMNENCRHKWSQNG